MSKAPIVGGCSRRDGGAHPPHLGQQLLLEDEIARQAVEAMHDQAPGLLLPQQGEGLGEGGSVSQGAAHPGIGHQVDESMPLGSAPRPHCPALHVQAGAGVDLAVG